MDSINMQSNQPNDLQTAQTAFQQTPQQPPIVTGRNKSQNTPMLVAVGLSMAIWYILSNIISYILLHFISPYIIYENSIEMNSFAASQIVSGLSSVIPFLIYAVIVIIGAAISCKKAKDRLMFFVCCISAKAIVPFITSAIMTVICSVCYLKDTNIYPDVYFKISIGIEYLCAIIVAVFVTLILRYITSQKTQTASSADSGTQCEASLYSDDEPLIQKQP